MGERKAEIKRRTKETDVKVSINLDGTGASEIETGVGFLDHMLELLSKHSSIDMKINAAGDRKVDDHHTVEDVGICLGQALRKALGDKKGITRFGDARVPMGEALADVALDLSGRGELVFNVEFPAQKVGEYDTELTEEFLGALCNNGGINLHVNVPYGANTHHINEAIFKALARALREAVSRRLGSDDVPSTKGVL